MQKSEAAWCNVIARRCRADKRNNRLTREGEPSQKADKGLEITIPKADEFFGLLKRALRKVGFGG
jgi:hypothetical protein